MDHSVRRRPGDEHLPHPHHESPAADDQHGEDRGHEDGEEQPGAEFLGAALFFFVHHCFVMSGSRWAMPLWQSMQVRSPLASMFEWASAARLLCLVKSIAWNSWQLRHSRESLAAMRSHSRAASSLRFSRNFSRVLMVPKIQPQTSFDACILRAIL